MTTSWVARLTAIDFVWNPDEVAWEAQLAQLAAYKAAHGDYNVPQLWAEDPRLANWVHNQRMNKRKADRGEHSRRMTAVRVTWLTALGFVWRAQRLLNSTP